MASPFGGNVFLNTKGFERFRRRFEAGMRTNAGPIHEMFTRWGKRYLTFVRRRFVRMSRGGWKGLAKSTLKGRRGPEATRRRKTRRRVGTAKTTTRGGAGRVAILRDTGTLLAGLTFGKPGNLLRRLPKAVRVGFGGPSRHPGGKATIADIAGFHNTGEGDLPKREIIVPPDQRTVEGMRRDVIAAARKIGRASAIL